MEHNIQIFQSERFGKVRIAINESNEPLFCLADVAKALGYSNPAKAVIDHCKGVTVLETPTQSGVQPIKYGKESEVYRLTMKSKLPMPKNSRIGCAMKSYLQSVSTVHT
ncbi:BRO family protein [Bacteroides fragilis]|nr:BRO family protein [Bacteroides fragilis]MCS2818624.1 BRO family protein [Bacteroides fragilis]